MPTIEGDVWKRFIQKLAVMKSPRVLEIGTRRWNPAKPGGHKAELLAINPKMEYVGCDATAGDDVDIVVDVHQLSKAFPAGHFSAVVCIATLEHFARPWVAAAEMAKVVRVGGVGAIVTHQVFPLHHFPSDYFRFTREALGELFAADIGWRVVASEYQFPCKILPLENYFPHAHDWNFAAESYLNVGAFIERVQQ